MRSVDRIPNILDRLGKIWEKYPDLRLGQLLLNCFSDPVLYYYIEDDKLIESLESYYLNIYSEDKEFDKFV